MNPKFPKDETDPENFDPVELQNETRRQCMQLATHVAEIYREKYRQTGAETDHSASNAAAEVAEAISGMIEA